MKRKNLYGAQKPIVGVMGPGGGATSKQCEFAYLIGQLIAQKGFVLLSGGMNGTMYHACMGAFEAGGLVVGICPTGDAADLNRYVHIPIVTNMGEGRNFINIRSSHMVIAITGPGHAGGTLSEVAFSLKDNDLPFCVTYHTPAMRTYLGELEKGSSPIQFANNIIDVENFLDTSTPTQALTPTRAF